MRESISIGPSTVLQKGVVYAMPAIRVSIIADGPLQFSLDEVNWTAIDTTGYNLSYPFVRALGGDVTIRLMKA